MLVSDFFSNKNKRFLYKPYDKHLLYVEEIDPGLVKIEKEFIKYCNDNNIDYSIECDEGNEKSYIVNFSTQAEDLRDYITSFIKNNNIQIVMVYDKSRKYDILFNFTVRPIMDDVTIPDIELLVNSIPINDRLDSRLSEEVLGIKPQHIIMTIGAPSDTQDQEDDDNVLSGSQCWTFSGRENDLEKLKAVMEAVQANDLSRMAHVKFDGIIRAEKCGCGCGVKEEQVEELPQRNELRTSALPGMEEIFNFMNEMPNIIDPMETDNEAISQ